MNKYHITETGALRLRHIADMIEQTGAFAYESWFDVPGAKNDAVAAQKLMHGACGTTGCIGGWAVAQALADGFVSSRQVINDPTETLAAAFLQISGWGAEHMFYGRLVRSWRKHHGEDVRDFCMSAVDAVEAAKVLRAVCDGEHPHWKVVPDAR